MMRIALLLMLLGFVVLARAQSNSGAVSFGCPEMMTVSESTTAAHGWEANKADVERGFERASIYNGKPGEREYELAPDGQKEEAGKITQVWHLKPYRTMNIFIRCRYQQTPIVLSRDVPVNLDTCTLTFEADSKGKIVGKSRLSCR